MEIQIPSPSVFLRKSPVLSNPLPAPAKSTKTAKPRTTTTTKPPVKTSSSAPNVNVQNGAVVKPKQSKSRNGKSSFLVSALRLASQWCSVVQITDCSFCLGCMTCKKKRLKCDETKPTCVQCEKRNVECEGYKKDYKWRSFEETNKTSRVGKGKKATNDVVEQVSNAPNQPDPAPHNHEELFGQERQERARSWSPTLDHAFNSATQALTGSSPPKMPSAGMVSPERRYSPSQFDPLPILHPGFSPSDFDLPPLHEPLHHHNRHRDSNDNPPFSTGSPNLVDLLLPGTDLRQPPDLSEPRPPMSPLPYQPGLADDGRMSRPSTGKEEEDFDEEILRAPMDSHFHDERSTAWMQMQRPPSPALSDTSSTSSRGSDLTLLRPPRLEPTSPEMLMCRFVQDTCGILSVKDGPSENPWRTLVLELGQGCEALSHAISSMSALHGATRDRSLRSAGIGHMNKSIRRLSGEIQSMRIDQALATSLALALGEGWDEKISTGIVHLKGANMLITKALADQTRNMERGLLTPADAKRMKFLTNTYVYLDVIARLSSEGEQASPDLEQMLEVVHRPFRNNRIEIDPLMGCATTLFPLMGKVAALIQRVRNTRVNSLNVIDEANTLRERLLDWNPPDHNFVQQPEDTNSSVHHAIHTAEAYRQAILLHLYQAVPELASEPSEILAHKIMKTLAGVPLSSNTLIVQIYPLLVGSCEMVAREDREFATKRWEAMMRRLSIVNVSSCWEIVQEVWLRRDQYLEAQRHGPRPNSADDRNFQPGQFIPPNLKRKTTGPMKSEQIFVDAPHASHGFFLDHENRPVKRRLTDTTGPDRMSAMGRQMTFTNRRSADAPISNIDFEYTVRGNLHWLAVMKEWQWEGESHSGPVVAYRHGCRERELTIHFA